MRKVLNLYAGLGGNRKLWTDCEVTAVEINESIAMFYQDVFTKDVVIITDAHEYLLNHYNEYDFIWSSINCPSHSRARFWTSKGGRYSPVYPDMKLYEEILFLKHYFNGNWVVENVIPYYEPLIKPTVIIERHMFWSNFNIRKIGVEKNNIFNGNIDTWQKETGFDISNYKFTSRRDKILRNCVNPLLGLHVYNESLTKQIQTSLF